MAWEELDKVPTAAPSGAEKVEKLLTIPEVPFKPSGIQSLDEFRQTAAEHPVVKALGEFGAEAGGWGYGAAKGQALAKSLGFIPQGTFAKGVLTP